MEEEEDLAAVAEQLYAQLDQAADDCGDETPMWWCDGCETRMDFCQDSFMYACNDCGKTIAIHGDAPAAGIANVNHNEVRVSRTTGRVYIETQRHTIADRVREDFGQINARLGGRINTKIMEEAIALTILVRGKSVFRKETRWGVPAACLQTICRRHKVEISDEDIVAACKIKTGALSAGTKRIKEARTAGHLADVSTGDDVDEASRMISMMLRKLNIEKSSLQKAAVQLVELDRSSRHARQISSRCAGAIWYIVKAKKLDISEEKMQQASGISVPTMTEVYKNIVAAMDANRALMAASRVASPASVTS